MLRKLRETLKDIKDKNPPSVEYGIILGTGLGGLSKEIKSELEMTYDSISHFPVSTVESHSGKLIFGQLGDKSVVAMQGRFHYYEGYSMIEVTYPVRIMKMLGIKKLFISNASGGLNPEYEISDLMIIRDHINLFPDNPLRGEHFDEFGPRFPDMSDAYDQQMIKQAEQIAEEFNIKIQTGVYAGVSGPTIETEAEYKYLRIIGADTVGMSTIPENIVARQMGIPCFAVSVVTDLGVPGKIEKVTIEKVIKAANKAEPYLTTIMKELIARQ